MTILLLLWIFFFFSLIFYCYVQATFRLAFGFVLRIFAYIRDNPRQYNQKNLMRLAFARAISLCSCVGYGESFLIWWLFCVPRIHQLRWNSNSGFRIAITIAREITNADDSSQYSNQNSILPRKKCTYKI